MTALFCRNVEVAVPYDLYNLYTVGRGILDTPLCMFITFVAFIIHYIISAKMSLNSVGLSISSPAISLADE
jgi:hypothetical protein